MDAVNVGGTVASPRVLIARGGVSIGQCNPVINGDFRDGLVGGFADPEGVWYSGLPVGWAGRPGELYAIRQIGQRVFANLHTLSGSFDPSFEGLFFRQSVGRSYCGRVSLRFDVDNPYNQTRYGDYSLTYQIIAAGAVAASGVVSGGRNAPRTVELEAQVGLGVPISIAFRKGAPDHAMGITDVSMRGVVRCGQKPLDAICVREQFFAGGIPSVIGACKATPFGARRIIRPVGVTRAPDPVAVKITGYVDDELLINGERTQAGQFPFMGYCNGAHAVDVSFVLSEESFSIAAGDNHGGQAGYDLTICFDF